MGIQSPWLFQWIIQINWQPCCFRYHLREYPSQRLLFFSSSNHNLSCTKRRQSLYWQQSSTRWYSWRQDQILYQAKKELQAFREPILLYFKSFTNMLSYVLLPSCDSDDTRRPSSSEFVFQLVQCITESHWKREKWTQHYCHLEIKILVYLCRLHV